MPVSFSSAPRNLFLLGSSGADTVTNFFKAIDKSSVAEDYLVRGIKYSEYDERYTIAGTSDDPSGVRSGWIEKRDYDVEATTSTEDWGVTLSTTTLPQQDLTLTDIHVDANEKLIVIGSLNTTTTQQIPFISRYSSNGILEWQSTSNTADVRYKGVTSDANGNYYVCGNTMSSDAIAFVEKFNATGNPDWGKAAANFGSDTLLNAIDVDSKGYVIAAGSLQDTNNEYKGYFVKLDINTGDIIWDRTLDITDRDWGSVPVVEINDIKIDGNDFIYIVGSQSDGVSGNSAGYICKYSPEGNMLWQKETPIGAANFGRWRYNCVEADTDTGQIIILGSYFENTSDEYGVLVKYSDKGDKIFTRVIESAQETPPEFGILPPVRGGMALDASASFYYVAFTDQDDSGSLPDKYTFGRVSSSGNGLGEFTYETGDLNTIDYTIQDIGDRIGRLSDGSVRYNTSDLATNILNPTRVMFDDFATPITNKKRQMNRAGDLQYSGSPAIRPVDFQELNLLGDVYSGSGDWLDQSGKGNDGVVNGATHNAAGYFEFDGVNDGITIPFTPKLAFTDAIISLEAWIYIDDLTNAFPIINKRDNYSIDKTNRPYIFEVNPSGQLRFSLDFPDGGPFTTICATSTGAIVTGQWYHVAGVHDGTTSKIYINGSESASVASGTTSLENTGDVPTRIGYRYTGSSIVYADGRISEVRIYPRALTAAQLFQNYNATKSKYINEAPDTGPKIGPGIVTDFSSLLNYDFGNNACYNTYQVKANLAAFSTSLVDTGKLLTPISRPDNPNQSFGSEISIGSGKIVVACDGFGDVIYVYDLLGQNETIIENPEAGNITEFASAIVVDNNRLYVGAIGHGPGGLVYIFDLNSGDLLQTITPSNTQSDDLYGTSIAVGDGKLVVGSPKHGTQQTFNMQFNGIPGTEYGAAFVYDLDTTGLVIDNTEKILIHSDPFKSGSNISGSITSGDWFGVGVAVGEGKIAVGARSYGSNGHGAVYVYDLDGTNEIKLAPETGTDDFFGASVRIGEGKLVVSVPRNNNFEFNLFETGSIYIYDLDDLSQFVHLYPSDVASRENKKFGSSIAIGDGKIAVGMFSGLSGPSNPRAMYLYDLDGTNEIFFGEDIGGLSVAIGEGIIATGTSYGTSATGDTADWIQGYVNLYSMLTPLPTTVKNLTNDTYSGTINGPTFNGDGSFQFDGIDDDIETGLSWSPANQFSFTMWFNLDTIKEWHNLVDMYNTESLRNFQLFVEGDGDFRIFWGNSTTGSFAITSPTTAANTWYFGAFTCDGENGKLFRYKSGEFPFSTATAPAGTYSVQPLVLGRRGDSDANGFVDGKIGEFQFYNRELTMTEVLQNYNATKSKYGY